VGVRRFVNDPDDLVTEAPTGLVTASRGALQLHTDPLWLASTADDGVERVALVSGGGSGHEPLSRALPESDPAGPAELAAGVQAGTDTVQRLGGAEVGDKTMVDAMVPTAAALTGATGGSLADALTAAAEAARQGAASTEELVAPRGRVSHVGEVARGVLDPGALTVGLFFAAGARAVAG
jgi:dihydroxyacetone kinase